MPERLETVRSALTELIKFLNPAKTFVNSHLNHFFTESLWDAHLPQQLRSDLDNLSVAELKQKFKSIAAANHEMGDATSVSRNSRVSFTESSLDDIICRISQLSLVSLKMSVKVSSLCLGAHNGTLSIFEQGKCDCGTLRKSESEWSSKKFDPFMSPKKMHEVEVMSEFIQRVATLTHVKDGDVSDGNFETGKFPRIVDFLVDVGSGKGYLSSFLTLLYKFRVLAIDSSAVNTYGCTKRTDALQKNWSSFLRRAQERQVQVDGALSKRGKHWKSKCSDSSRPSDRPHGSDDHGRRDDDPDGVVDADCTPVRCGYALIDPASPVSTRGVRKAADTDDDKLKNVTLFVTEILNLSELLKEAFPVDFVMHSQTGTHNVASPFGIIGLHTCGDLGVTSVKLFAQSKNSRFIVNVPCCYHLMEESYGAPESPVASSGNPPGFPLSLGLREIEFYLGRNARMMSAQSIHRMSSDENDLSIPQPLLYRAILQVIIREKLGRVSLEKSVGRLGSKFSEFLPYVRKALAKIKCDDAVVSDDEIESTYEKYVAHSERFHKYFLFRALFAPLVEACILLDRLAYLLEQGDVLEAFIVELFNPFLSPRCHALVAVR